MSQYVFGTGQLFALPVAGAAAAAPLRFGALQDVSVDFSGDIKELYGQYQFALDSARGKTKVEWKATSGNIDIEAFNQIFFGETVTTGDELIQVFNEAASVPAAAPFTVTAANDDGFYLDLGVYDSVTGLPLKQVQTAPTTGQYQVNPATGVYTFAAADANRKVLLNYMYQSADTGGSMEITNQLLGTTPRFQLVLSQVYEGKAFSLILYSNVADKLSLPLKQDDYLLAELSGSSFADAANRIGRITTTSIGGGGA